MMGVHQLWHCAGEGLNVITAIIMDMHVTAFIIIMCVCIVYLSVGGDLSDNTMGKLKGRSTAKYLLTPYLTNDVMVILRSTG